MELRPLGDDDQDLLASLQAQDDVWESLGALPAQPGADHLFVVLEGGEPVGIAGLVRSPVMEGELEVLCAMRDEMQHSGLAYRACQLVLAWAFDTAKLERVTASIEDGNAPARAIATKLGMRPLKAVPPRTVFVKYRQPRS
jgi:RimJ/RimL family protein N-acetyltransferase